MKYICDTCGCEFETDKKIVRITCNECRQHEYAVRECERRRKQTQINRSWRNEIKKKKKPKKYKSISQVLRDLQRYNEDTGNKLSYGQYINLYGEK